MRGSRKEKVRKICPICQANFEVYPSLARLICCSKTCANKRLSLYYKEKYAKDPQSHPMVGRKLTDEWKANKLKNMTKKPGRPKGSPGTFTGKHHTVETKERIRLKKTGVKAPLGTGEKIGRARKLFYEQNPEARLEASIKSKEILNRPEVKAKRCAIMKKVKNTPESRAKNSATMKRIARERDYIRHIWDNKDAKPNKFEQWFISFCQRHSLPFKYTGAGSFRIESINPDFVESNGRKLAVDLFGDYWHTPLFVKKPIKPEYTEAGRKAILKKYGWKLLVIWQSELNLPDFEERILSKLRKVGVKV